MNVDYNLDFYRWTQQQANCLRNKQFENIDWDNIAEEIADMGRSEKRQLEGRLPVLNLVLLMLKKKSIL